MTTIPQPADPTKSYTATYDAWNRLVKLVDGANTVSEYEYDAAKRRTIQKPYTAGVLDETRHLYYTEPRKWQVVEERIDASTNPDRQFIWGLRYIDDLTFRDRDTTGNGALDERLYALQDANWNVTAITDTVGSVQERYGYTAYGVPSILDASFKLRSSSDVFWNTLYAGCQWDHFTEVFHVRHRAYSSLLGAWTQRDPLGLGASINLYEYCGAYPLTHSDPTGAICGIGGPLFDDIVNCFCLVARVFDLFNIGTLATETVDCICNFITAADLWCSGRKLACVGQSVLSLLDCFSDQLGAL